MGTRAWTSAFAELTDKDGPAADGKPARRRPREVLSLMLHRVMPVRADGAGRRPPANPKGRPT